MWEKQFSVKKEDYKNAYSDRLFWRWESNVTRQWMSARCQHCCRRRTPGATGFLQGDFVAAALHMTVPQAAAVKMIRIQISEAHPIYFNWSEWGSANTSAGTRRQRDSDGQGFAGLPRQHAAAPASRARLFGLGPQHLWWLCFLSDPQSFGLQVLGPSFMWITFKNVFCSLPSCNELQMHKLHTWDRETLVNKIVRGDVTGKMQTKEWCRRISQERLFKSFISSSNV